MSFLKFGDSLMNDAILGTFHACIHWKLPRKPTQTLRRCFCSFFGFPADSGLQAGTRGLPNWSLTLLCLTLSTGIPTNVNYTGNCHVLFVVTEKLALEGGLSFHLHLRFRHVCLNGPPKLPVLGQTGHWSLSQGDKVLKTPRPWGQWECKPFLTDVAILYLMI